MNDLTKEIDTEIVKAIEALGGATTGCMTPYYDILVSLGADSSLLSIVGSWNDTLSDRDVLDELKAYNERISNLHK